MSNDLRSRRPNILLFLTDDHGTWANGCYGNSEVQTPNLDRLASEGTRFANAFTPTPVCSPARACLLTGRTASQVGIHDWLQEAELDVGDRDWLADDVTLLQLLHDAGYSVGLSGKWHLGQSHLKPRGADYHFGLPRWQGAHNESYVYVDDDGGFVELDGNKSAYITDHAIEFLDQAPADHPFFLNIGYIATHSPYGQHHHDPAVTALYQHASFDDIPAYNTHLWVKNEDGPGDSPPSALLRDRYIGYYAAVTEIDNNIGRILDKLEALGQLDNTIIIYTSDHGCAQGHHGFWGKGNSTRPLNMYETSLSIPLIWRGPGIAAGQVIEQAVDHYDGFSTLLDIVDIVPDEERNYPGHSYRAMLQGERVEWDETIYGEYGDLRMIRTPQWKLVLRYPDGPNDLFDLVNDPHEVENLINDSATAPVVAELTARLDAFYAKHEIPEKSGLRVKEQHRHNAGAEAWRDGRREARGLQIY